MTLFAKNKVSATALDKKFASGTGKAEKSAAAILEILKKKKVSVDIYLAGEALMKKLNSDLRNKEYSADILSFEEPEGFVSPEKGQKKLGEIFLNWPRIAKKGKSAEEEIKKLLVHGILHLLGHKHDKNAEAEKMERKEKAIIKKLK
jgi:probable rRNA maturation factor